MVSDTLPQHAPTTPSTYNPRDESVPVKKSPEEFERLAKTHDSSRSFWLTETIQLAPWYHTEQDKDALLEYLNDPRVYIWLYGPPNPYTANDADNWLSGRVDRMTNKGTPLAYALRDMTRGGKAVGSVSVSDESDDNLTGDDTGYWLAPEYHGQGMMAKALKLLLQEVSIKEVGKRKFNSHAFPGNWASRRTMEKAGFVYQPQLSQKVVKDGKEIDLWVLRLYLTEEDIAKREVIVEATPSPSLVQ
ncbi:hypothetical protein BGX28_005710 [Mortierella sp. GBA30]|nr:hypothetical protein BGX28_005710 [Mortierella sp. GBA30]